MDRGKAISSDPSSATDQEERAADEAASTRKRGRQMLEQQQLEMQVPINIDAPPPARRRGRGRGRGRPRGSGGRQPAPATSFSVLMQDEGAAIQAGAMVVPNVLTPFVITVQGGERIDEAIEMFSRRTSPASFCILSGHGTVFIAELGASARAYQGKYWLLSLSGFQIHVEGGILRHMYIQMVDPLTCMHVADVVTGKLIAGGPTQIVVASFSQEQRPEVGAASQQQQLAGLEGQPPAAAPAYSHLMGCRDTYQ